MAASPTTQSAGRLREVAVVFLKLGCIAFGGPAAHIAMMRDEVVRRRGWIDDQGFLDLLGATNLIPGPNSTEMAIHLGLLRAGRRGLIVAGTLFILPAMLIVLALAWAYVTYGNLPEAQGLLYGIKPVILAIVAQALWNLGRTAIKSRLTALIGVGALALYVAGWNELTILALSGIVTLLAGAGQRWRASGGAALLLAAPKTLLAGGIVGAAPINVLRLFLIFLKIGAVLYGSGYVLLAFLRTDLVVRTGWLTDQQLLDAVAIGQFTPGPVFTTATFIGYLVAGLLGAILATIGIFLPSFVFVALSQPLIPRIRRSRTASLVLDGVNVASLGLMAAVTIQLGRAALVDPVTIALGVIAAALLLRFKVNSAWLVLGGGVAGLMVRGL